MKDKIKVLVVDDSGFVISAITRRLRADPQIEVIDSARNGVEALNKVKELRPDVVTMDVIMPEMDGLTALKHIMAECPTPVLMLSALTGDNADTTIRALESGAVDFYLKPSVIRPDGNGSGDNTLIEKIRLAAGMDVGRKKRLFRAAASIKRRKPPEKPVAFHKLVVIASSTGGPRALMQIVPNLPGNIPAAILIVQHMPPMFTRSLAVRLHQASEIAVAEAREGDTLSKGVALIAPGDYHMIVGNDGAIRLTRDSQVLGVRPAADVTMRSVASIYGNKTLGVVLTGMGTDSTIGASFIKAAGGTVLAQDEATCAVFGMPSSVIKAGCADKIVPLHKMSYEINRFCR